MAYIHIQFVYCIFIYSLNLKINKSFWYHVISCFDLLLNISYLSLWWYHLCIYLSICLRILFKCLSMYYLFYVCPRISRLIFIFYVLIYMFLSMYPCIYLSNHISIYLSIYLAIYLSIVYDEAGNRKGDWRINTQRMNLQFLTRAVVLLKRSEWGGGGLSWKPNRCENKVCIAGGRGGGVKLKFNYWKDNVLNKWFVS